MGFSLFMTQLQKTQNNEDRGKPPKPGEIIPKAKRFSHPGQLLMKYKNNNNIRY